MNRNFLLLLSISLLLFSCSSTSPDQYFGRAALSSNLLYGFASDGFHREFASPSEKLVDASSGKTAPMKRAEVLKTKVDAVEEAYANVKRLKIADDNREMLNASGRPLCSCLRTRPTTPSQSASRRGPCGRFATTAL